MDIQMLLAYMKLTPWSDSCSCSWKHTSGWCPESKVWPPLTVQRPCWSLREFPTCPGIRSKLALTHAPQCHRHRNIIWTIWPIFFNIVPLLRSWITVNWSHSARNSYTYQHDVSTFRHDFYVWFQNFIMEAWGHEPSVLNPLVTH